MHVSYSTDDIQYCLYTCLLSMKEYCIVVTKCNCVEDPINPVVNLNPALYSRHARDNIVTYLVNNKGLRLVIGFN
jgi:hypothetical protein